MNIPTVIFINKIDQAGVDLQSVVQSVRDKLSADIIIKQTVSLSPEIVLEENTDIEAWDAVIEITMNYWKVYRRRTNQPGKTCAGGTAAGSRRLPVPSLSWQRQKWPWHSTVDGCGDRAVPTDWGTGGAALCGSVSRLSTPIAASGVSIYGYTAERCACGIRWPWPGEKS